MTTPTHNHHTEITALLAEMTAAFMAPRPPSFWVDVGRRTYRAGLILSNALDRVHAVAAARLHPAPADPLNVGDAMALLDRIWVASTHLADGYAMAARDDHEAALHTATATLSNRQAELAALHRVNAAVNSSLDEQAILATVTNTVTDITRAEVCSIYLYQPPDTLILRATRGLNQQAVGRARLFIGEGLTGVAALEGRPVAVEDIRTDPRSKYLPETLEDPFHSILCVPIILFTRKQLIGVLNIQTCLPRRYPPEEIAFVEMVCGELALAIENARLYQRTDAQLQRKVAELTTLRRVVSVTASSLDGQRVLETIADAAVALSGAEASAIIEMKPASGEMAIVATRTVASVPRPTLDGDALLALRQAIKDATPVTVAYPAAQQSGGAAGPEVYRSMFCVPFQGRRDVSGAICVFTRNGDAFTTDASDLLVDFANEAAIAINNAKLFDQARRALDTKSALLSEMHHRVKNNLQTVASLLSLGLRHAKSPEAADVLQESKARIQSIAAIHDLLSQEDVGFTTVDQVAKKIIEIAEVHVPHPDLRVRFALQSEQVAIASQQATTLAMVLNELLSNTLRHAFPGRTRGAVEIAAHAEGNRIVVSVSDDGIGLPTTFDLERDKGLGLSIVETLTRQDLGGHLSCQTRRQLETSDPEGTLVTLTFPRVMG